MILLLGATSFLLTLSDSQERAEAQNELVTDSLWVRQSLQFQFEREAEALGLIAADQGNKRLSRAALEARLQVFLRRGRESLVVAWTGPTLAPSMSLTDPSFASMDPLDAVPPAVIEAAMARALREGEAVFSAPFAAPWGAGLVLVAPVNGEPRTFLVAVYWLERLLEEMVPWSFAQSHEVTIGDVTGTVRARRASAGRGRGVYTHQAPLEIPGSTLILGTNSLKGPPDWITNVIRGGTVVLALLLFWSLWALWRDVQRRVAAEHRLREEVAFRRAMGDSAVIGLRARDLGGRVTFVNPAFCRMVGLPEEGLVGYGPPMPYWIPERTDEYRRRVEEVLSGQASTAPFETVFQRANGERFPVVIYDAPLRDADGRQTGWMSSIIDATEEKQAEERERVQHERLQTAARLTTMGEMASSLAHELNQPLGAIASYLAGSLNLIERGGATAEELGPALAKASQQAQRAGQVIRRVHEFVRKREPQRAVLEAAKLIEECRALVELQARRSEVQISVQSEPGVPAIVGDAVMLEQVILNLTRNAIEAMAEVEPGRRLLVIGAKPGEGGGACIVVRDYGAGIPDSVAGQLFSTFFTTKPDGMGMGLSICRSIVEAHGGRLGFERLDLGTEFRMHFPAP
ncbi:MAG: PAS domain S-box protein [Betaproteobacteria bacterium]|nr:PAS domain S-box protein [Betaproteobacteria bacterium]